MGKIRKYLSKPLLDRRLKIGKDYIRGDVLDIGCGYGDAIQFLDGSQHYVGIDQNKELIRYLRDKYPNYEFYSRDLEFEKLTIDHKFDTILMLAFIEHIKNPRNILEECYKLLKDAGNLILTTPTSLGDMGVQFLNTLFQSKKEREQDIKPHVHIYSYSDMKRSATACGFDIYICRRFEMRGNQLFVIRKRGWK